MPFSANPLLSPPQSPKRYCREKRAIERHVVYPLASLLATEQVSLGDVISIDWDGVEAGLKFSKEAQRAGVLEEVPVRKTMSKVLAASCGAPGSAPPRTASVWAAG